MKHYFTVLLLLISFFGFSQTLKIPKDTMVVTNHTTTIKIYLFLIKQLRERNLFGVKKENLLRLYIIRIMNVVM